MVRSAKQVLAEVIREWLPSVLHNVEPWISSEDIEKGKSWSPAIATQLEESSAGIICVTKDNIVSPWLNFESGAIAKSVKDSYVCPYLFQVSPSELKGPLSQFQATESSYADTKKLIYTLNQAVNSRPLPQLRLQKTFDKWWPDLESELRGLKHLPTKTIVPRSDRDLLEEILENVRQNET